MKNSTCSTHLSNPLASGLHRSDSPPLTQTGLKKACIITIAQSVGKALWNWLIRNADPIVSEHRDDDGVPYYQVYDPVDEAIYKFALENEVRIWLKQRYY